MAELLIGRQPIFNRKQEVVAYELLYRAVSQSNQAGVIDGDQATTQVILNTFSEMGLDAIVGENKAFINATRNFLVGKYPIPLPPGRVILEVLEDIKLDAQVVDALRGLVRAGYMLALDDVVSAQRVAALQGLARIVKIDLIGMERSRLAAIVETIRPFGVLLLAEKVETQEEYNICYRLGFDFFQGYFLCKPVIVSGRRIDASRLVVLRLLAKLQDSRANFEALEEIVAQDVSLGYKLLKLVNSGYYSLATTVKSIRQAISLIGLDQLSGWMTLLLMTTVERKPHELTVIALQRARMCEMFARARGKEQSETFFMVGLLSVLDALMDVPMERIISNMSLSPEVVAALLRREGEPGAMLRQVIAYEQGDWDTVMKINLNPDTIRRIFLESIQWANVLTQEMRRPD